MRVTARLRSTLVTLTLTSISIVVIAATPGRSNPRRSGPSGTCKWRETPRPPVRSRSRINANKLTRSASTGSRRPIFNCWRPPQSEVAGHSSYQLPVRSLRME